jgi:hypothetical protein
MTEYRKGFVSVDSGEERRWYPAEILVGSETRAANYTTVKARFNAETARRIVDESNATYGNGQYLRWSDDSVITGDVDGPVHIEPDSDDMYAINAWGWEEVEIIALTAVVIVPKHDAESVETAVRDALKRNDARLLAPCGWSPDPDTIAECLGGSERLDDSPFDMVRVLDLNP